MTVTRWLCAIGAAVDDCVLEVQAADAQAAAEQAAEPWGRHDRRLLAGRRSLPVTVTVPDTGDRVAFTVRAFATPIYHAHLEALP